MIKATCRLRLLAAAATAFGVLSGGLEPPAAEAHSKKKKPNFIVILADDFGDESYAINNPQTADPIWPLAAPVPNLETLVEHGVNFTNGWAMPACSTTRGTRTLGVLPSTSGMGPVIGAPAVFGFPTNTPRFGAPGPFAGVEFPPTMINPNSSKLLHRIMKDAGYKTAKIGKWHETEVPPIDPENGPFRDEAQANSRVVQDVLDSGFDEFYGILVAAPTTPWGGAAPVTIFTSEVDDTADPTLPTQYRTIERFEFITSNLVGETIDFIKENEDTPFFIALDFNAPHFADPDTGASYFVAPGPNEPAPAGEGVTDWRTLDPTIHANLIAQVDAAFPGDGYPPAGTGSSLLPPPGANPPPTPAQLQLIQAQRRAAFKSLISYVDVQMGRLLEHVDLSDTYVLFIGDNGTQGVIGGNPVFDVVEAPNDTARSKGTLYQNGVKVPYIIAGPGVKRPGRDSDAPITTTDVLATVTDLAGIRAPRETKRQSFSAKRLLKGWRGLRRYNVAEIFGSAASVGGFGAPAAVEGRVVADKRYRLIANPVLTRNDNDTPANPQDDFNEFVCRADFTPSGDPFLDPECFNPATGVYEKEHQLEFYDTKDDPLELRALTFDDPEMSIRDKIGFRSLCRELNRISRKATYFQNGRKVCDIRGRNLIGIDRTL